MKTRPSLFLGSFLLLTVAACGGADEAVKPQSPPSAEQSKMSTAAPGEGASMLDASAAAHDNDTQTPPAATSGSVAASSATPPPAPDLTDAQILQVTHTANAGEIEQAKLAQSKAKDARVKKLAAMMLKDHTDADAKGTKLAKKAAISPEASPTSTSLESDAQSATASLKGQSGADFDKAYVDTQVKEHQAVLDTIDQKLLPAAKNADLKAYLAEVRPAIATHLQHAKDLQTDLQK